MSPTDRLASHLLPPLAARTLAALLGAATVLSTVAQAGAEESEPSSQVIELADGKIRLQAPAGWERQKPRNRIVEHEFSTPAVEGEERDGRVTVMGAGGSVEENLRRWQRQFVAPNGKKTEDLTKLRKLEIQGTPVHVIELEGTYLDQPGGPFTRSPTTLREDYRMLAAIVETKKLGRYFIKLYGPDKTVAAQRAGFEKMLESLEVEAVESGPAKTPNPSGAE